MVTKTICSSISRTVSQGANRPGDVKALTSRIQSRIGHDAVSGKVAAVMARLETIDVIKIVNGELIYMANANKKGSARAQQSDGFG